MITSIVRRRLSVPAALLCSAMLFPLPAQATAVDTQWGKILSLNTGWNLPYMHLEMSFPFVNPDGCPWGGLYSIPPDTAGYETFQSLAMSAYFAGKEVALTIDGCTGSRPKIIGVRVRG